MQIKYLGLKEYEPLWRDMVAFTDARQQTTKDELWLVEHLPVFTLGQAGKTEHILNPGDIPIVSCDRGGQVTYHGPGQLVAYPLLNIKRLGLGVRDLVTLIEETVVSFLERYNINAYARADAPGVYVDDAKIASLGLRIRRGCSYHGVAININMDLEPFERINPCGYPGMKIVDVSRLLDREIHVSDVQEEFSDLLAKRVWS